VDVPGRGSVVDALAGELGHAPLKPDLGSQTIVMGSEPPRLEWRSGEPRSGIGDEARQVGGLHRLLAAAHCRLRPVVVGLKVMIYPKDIKYLANPITEEALFTDEMKGGK
jgi:hypothetical protein